MDDLYIYLRARSVDAVGRVRPAKHEDKPPAAQQAEVPAWASAERRPVAARRWPGGQGEDGDDECRAERWLLDPASGACWRRRSAARLASAMQVPEGTDLSIELVDPKVLRVCADPRNLPFSNDKGEEIENKLAELFAAKLQKRLDYMYFPQATGFVKMTLGAHRCDVIMGFPQGDDLVQGTNPYYRTAYALVTKAGSGLDEVATPEDARLKGKHIGIVAGTPPATNMAVNGLMMNAKPYPLIIDTRDQLLGDGDDQRPDLGPDRRRRAVGSDGGLLPQSSPIRGFA